MKDTLKCHAHLHPLSTPKKAPHKPQIGAKIATITSWSRLRKLINIVCF